jgi:predicted nucleotidyltransferase
MKGAHMEENTIKENILKTLLYYHIFNHPLTLDEIYAFFPKADIPKRKIKRVLSNLISDTRNLLGEINGFYFISPNSGFVWNRLKREYISRKKWKIARIMTVIIKLFPFVRGVFVTGTLSKNSSDENSDIDFLIICRENRVWITRTMLRLFAKLFLLHRNKFLCANYFLAENNLSINDRNVFTATELAHIKVMYNSDVFKKLIESNQWIEQYFPNCSAADDSLHLSGFSTSDKPLILQQVFELFFPGKIGDAIDGYLQGLIKRRLESKYADYAARERNLSFVITSNTAKLHGSSIDHKKIILDKLKNLFRKYNLTYQTD